MLATFRYPNGICFDGIGNLYVSDTESYKVRKINIATTAVTTVAGSGTAAYQDGTGTGASFDFPDGICLDNGNLYVVDEYIHLIRKIVIATGVVSTFAGSGVGSSNDGIGTAATFNAPIGICTDGNSNLYVTEILGHKLRKISIATKQVTTLAGASTCGYADGTGTNASFFGPVGICYNGNGSLFLADLANYAIRQIVIATGEVTTFAGSGNMGSANGTGIDASFNEPHSITYYNSNFYVTDSANHKIRKITSSILNSSMFENANTMALYPNPSTGIYNIDVNGDATIEIFDIVGKQLQSQKISIGANQLDLTQYNAGVYLAKVTNNLNQSKTIKIVKQ